MATLAHAGAGLTSKTSSHGWGPLVAVLAVAALIIRAPDFGNPDIHLDETFYLYFADLMLQGAVPYVDIWDRKPIGLFLLYGGIRLLGGDGIIQYQVVATVFACATAFIVALIARRRCGQLGACLAGILYLVFLDPLGGAGGQSPVFYNLFIAGAALLTLQAVEAGSLRSVTVRGTCAMLLCGLAMQIKYPAVVEGCFFGLVLLWLIWSRTRQMELVFRWGAVFALCGIAPTAAAFLAFAAMGHGEAFWFANFASILLRPASSPVELQARLYRIAIILLPLAATAVAAIVLRRSEEVPQGRSADLFLFGWMVAALAGFGLIGTFFVHYSLPLVAPLAVLAAPILDRRPLGLAFFACLAAWTIPTSGYPTRAPSSVQRDIGEITEAVNANLGDGCLFAYDGPPIVQHLTQACQLTPYILPYHLNAAVERTGLGVDPGLEMHRILAQRPSVIVTSNRPITAPNVETRTILKQALERDYRLVKDQPAGTRRYQIYAREVSRASR